MEEPSMEKVVIPTRELRPVVVKIGMDFVVYWL
jgi:hypothetical protein